MMRLEDHITELCNQHFENSNLFLVDLKISSNDKIVVFIDKLEADINIRDCARLSRFLENELEEKNLVKETYQIDVSSPGLSTPLKGHKQYVKNVGRQIEVWDLSNTKIEGLLTQVDEQKIILEKTEGKGKKKVVKNIELPFDEITKTKIKIVFKK